MREIGDRIRSSMPDGMTQRQLAALVGMPPDALSRALNGQRGIAPLEVARVADALGADLQWLITGRPDPFRVEPAAARHAWDATTGVRSIPGRASDQATIDQVVAAYRAAFPGGPPSSQPLPTEPARVRAVLGEGFVRSFSDLVESELDVDVIRVAGLSTDYSFRIGDRGLILLSAIPHWFRSNWSLAHELGHLALGHHATSTQPVDEQEPSANRFAAELLLPTPTLRAQAWGDFDRSDVAQLLWESGVSSDALGRRLTHLGISLSPELNEALTWPTKRLIRQQLHRFDASKAKGDPITMRERDAAARRLPLLLQSALTEQVERGLANPELLAWVLDIPVDDVDFPEPSEAAVAAAYAGMVADRPTPAEVRSLLGP